MQGRTAAVVQIVRGTHARAKTRRGWKWGILETAIKLPYSTVHRNRLEHGSARGRGYIHQHTQLHRVR
jgi:hypothetical protein